MFCIMSAISLLIHAPCKLVIGYAQMVALALQPCPFSAPMKYAMQPDSLIVHCNDISTHYLITSDSDFHFLNRMILLQVCKSVRYLCHHVLLFPYDAR